MQANNSSFVAYGTTNAQMQGCVIGPTNTPTKTNTPGSPTATFTSTFTVTVTPTFTPLSGCKNVLYDGETAATNYASGSNWTTNATVSEVTTSPHGGTDDLQLAYNWLANSYFAGLGWNWAKYSAASPRIINLANYTVLEFWI